MCYFVNTKHAVSRKSRSPSDFAEVTGESKIDSKFRKLTPKAMPRDRSRFVDNNVPNKSNKCDHQLREGEFDQLNSHPLYVTDGGDLGREGLATQQPYLPLAHADCAL